ncbi:hypothetical protein M409DRAFT_17283 [Zasmidium cellare ATCC 36951]|uniref:PIN domain-containing protein n=1 Tax=Zasmidium cellare ATCC 36951 TaxID=1080233 RepID=A0A6A6D1P0_ZASCE|nr:uncharacterized protein M409DRAFT_17283 [Zasmidium cellare ATCC 36951]KAF2173344.1 hypothetical protein M409DRAFT_17283 [Zasmidium cellare ATCC 36951]
MRPRPRPASQHGANQQTRPAGTRPTRKVFNCIVDDSALVAGVKKSTRNGIRQWVKNGQIRLFVPLHALEELSLQKGGKNRHAEDVRETLQWLDEATTKHPNVVTLQGADETYERWAEVERFAVPRTLFSENDHDLEPELESNPAHDDNPTKRTSIDANLKTPTSSVATDMSRSASPSSLKSMQSSTSPLSPPTSPAKAVISPVQNMRSLVAPSSHPQSSSASVPNPLQPLFNYILWRIHQETDPVAALESFIFLCNDPRKVNYAKGFDIKTKRLEQLREAVGREDRDFKNRQAMLARENQNVNTTAAEDVEKESDGDEIPTKSSPPKAPAAMLNKQQSNVIDPDAFSRGPPPKGAGVVDVPNGAPKSPRVNPATQQRGSPRAVNALPFAPRGARGNVHGNFRGGARGRGAGRGGFANGPTTTNANAPAIDPNSFTRPDPRGGFHGARGGRKLWVPT